MKSKMALPVPTPKNVVINGHSYTLVAFYYPGYNEPWDKVFNAPFLGNFYPCQFSLTIGGIKGTFHNAEAAFQATKWWGNAADRKLFENALTGADAFKIKKGLPNPDYGYYGLGRDGAMLAVTSAKFNLPDFKQGLLQTGSAYLLEHNAVVGRDNYWSDDHNGTGKNMLGITLMKVRQGLGGAGIPQGKYTVADFTNQV